MRSELTGIRALAAAALMAAACGKTSDAPAIGRHQNLQYPVDVAPLEQRSLMFSINASNGTINAYQVQITARVAGPVDDVKFAIGDEIKKGQPLVTIDRARYAIALDQAKAAYAKAVATEKSAEAALERRLEAQKESPGLVPGEEIEQKQTAVDTAKADVEAARQAQQVSELDLSESIITSPVPGIVQTRTVDQGQYLNPGNLLATIIQHEPLKLGFSIMSDEAPRLRHAMEHGPITCSFVIDGSTYRYTATISFLADSADPSTRLFAAEAEIIPPTKDAKPEDKHAVGAEKRLRPSTHAVVTIPIGTPRPGIVVPQIAVQPTDKGDVVYVVDQSNIAHQRIVTTGLHTPDGGIELTKGVSPGELLVVAGSDPLSEGVSVTVKNRTTLEAATLAGTDAGIDDTMASSGSATGSAAASAAGSGR